MFLGSFLNDWWDAISKFFHELDTTLFALIMSVLALLFLLCVLRFIKPMFSVDKNKIKVLPLVFMIIFGGLIALISCAAAL